MTAHTTVGSGVEVGEEVGEGDGVRVGLGVLVLLGTAIGVKVAFWLVEHAASVMNRKLKRIIGLENFMNKCAPLGKSFFVHGLDG